MIITDIKQIDRIAEETFGEAKGIISVDMRDYAFIKENSESLKVIKLGVSALTEDDISRFIAALNFRPRKCLGWKTPYEVAFNEVLHLT